MQLSHRPKKALIVVLVAVLVLSATTLLSRPAPAEAAQADQIIVRAHGTAGSEQMVLRVNGQDVSTWTVSTSPRDYVFSSNQTLDVQTLEVAFINDQGAIRDLIVDYVDVGGIKLQSESSSTISTGTWLPGAGCRSRASISPVLHCRGSFTYDVPPSTIVVPTPVPQPTTCLLYTSPSPRDATLSRMPSSA